MRKTIIAFLFLVAAANCGVAQTDRMPFTVDLSNSSFKLNRVYLQEFYYTVNGVGSTKDSVTNYFYIKPVPITAGRQHSKETRKWAAKEYFDILKGYKTTSAIEEKEIEINKEATYEIYFTTQTKNTISKEYIVILGNNKQTLKFHGKAFSNYDEMLKEFKSVVQTLKLK